MADASFQMRAGVLHTPLLGGPFNAVYQTKFLVLGFVAQKRERQNGST